MTNEENDYIKTVGFGYDISGMDRNKWDLLDSTIAGYLAGYQRARGDLSRVQFTWYDQDKYAFYIEEHHMGVKDLVALRQVLPEELRNRVRLCKIATRMVPEIIAMPIGDIETTEDIS